MRVIGERLREARKLRGVSQTKLAQLIGTSGSQLSQVEHEQSGTSIRTALAAAQALNVSMDYLVGFVDDPTPTRELVLHMRAQTALLVDLGIVEKVDEEENLEVDSEDFVGVNEIVASAGTGAEVINERITDRVKFRRPWMRRHGMQAHLCRLVKVIGESMEPTLPDGSSILARIMHQGPDPGRDTRASVW